jgi:hypothetical protein
MEEILYKNNSDTSHLILKIKKKKTHLKVEEGLGRRPERRRKKRRRG